MAWKLGPPRAQRNLSARSALRRPISVRCLQGVNQLASGTNLEARNCL